MEIAQRFSAGVLRHMTMESAARKHDICLCAIRDNDRNSIVTVSQIAMAPLISARERETARERLDAC